MSILKLAPSFLSNSSIEFGPKRVFSSSSSGITGSINVIVNRSDTQKDNIDLREGLSDDPSNPGPQNFNLNTFEGRRKAVYDATFDLVGQGTIFDENPPSFDYDLQLGLLMDGIDAPELKKKKYSQLNLNFAEKGYSDLPMHPRNSYQLHCSRSVPGTDFISKAYRKKEIIRNILDKSNSIGRTTTGWEYTNFNCLNFFKTNSTSIPAVVFSSDGPNPSTARYLPTGSLQINFRIKVPRHPIEAGTICHLPGCYAVSIVTGSTIDSSGKPEYYKLLLQMGTEAQGPTLPSAVDLTVANLDRGTSLIYQSLPNITASIWHDCTIRISETENNFTGSFLIDGNPAGTFEPPSSFSVTSSLEQTANILTLGSYYTGNIGQSNAFFGTQTAATQGVQLFNPSVTAHPLPLFSCSLDAEVYEVKILDGYDGLSDIRNNLGQAVTSSIDYLFHLPVLYSSGSPPNRFSGLTGDLTSDSSVSTTKTSLKEFFSEIPPHVTNAFDSPFNSHHSNIGGFLNINAQAFLKDWKSGNYPYLHMLSSSLRNYTSQHVLSSSWALFDEHQRRNTLIMPCDDGSYNRNYEIYLSNPQSIADSPVVFKNRPEIISLKSIGDFTSNYDSRLSFVDEAWRINESVSSDVFVDPTNQIQRNTIPGQSWFSPVDSGLVSQAIKSSNMVVIFSIPTLFYGSTIRPGTIKMHSDLYQGGGSVSSGNFIKGTDYRMPVSLCDDSNGNIIRNDTSGSLALNNYVGSVYYEDGIIVLKSPHLYNFGEHKYTLEFEGLHKTHMLEMSLPISKNLLNSSSNPNYNRFKPYSDRNEQDSDSFVYISTVNFHDENLNVIAKARLAQPIIKRPQDNYLLRVKFDF